MVDQIGGSLTTYTEKNPSFMVIEMDAKTLLPVNFKTYYFDLVEANEHPDREPNWTMLHDYKEYYQMEDLSPSSFLKLSERFAVDQDLANLYSWNKRRQYGAETTNANGLHLFCGTSTSEMWQYNDCIAAVDGTAEYEWEGRTSSLPSGGKFNFHGLSAQALADWIIGNWVNISD